MKKLLACLIVTLAWVTQASALTCGLEIDTGNYIVSGVLRKNELPVSPSGNKNEESKKLEITIKLVHSVVKAASGDAALAMFKSDALAQYPGYSFADLLATPIKVETRECVGPIKHGKEISI